MENKREILFTFTPEKEELDYVQFLFFEINSYKRILEEIIVCKNPKYSYSTDNFKFFMEEFKMAEAKFNVTMSSLLKSYAPEYTSDKYSYNFDFEAKIVEIYETGKGGNTCDCGRCKN